MMSRFGGGPGKEARIMRLAEDMGDEVWTFEQMLQHVNHNRNQRSHIERRQLASYIGRTKCFIVVFRGRKNGARYSEYAIDRGLL